MTNDDESTPDSGRRRLLKRTGLAFGAPFVVGSTAYRLDRSYVDEDGDGIPDRLERSESFHRNLESVFGADQFTDLDPERKDLLIDVRYVGDATITRQTANRMEDRFRSNGIHLQWLEYPNEYDRTWFEEEYGYHAKNILWGPTSFYHDQIESDLKDIALQLIVLPESSEPRFTSQLDSFWTYLRTDIDSLNGMSFGNRAVVREQDSVRTELELVLHEVGHLALCHDDDPANTGVMGIESPTTEIDFMDWEWEYVQDNLGAIRDTTGFDVASRGCIWDEAVVESLTDRIGWPS